MPQDWGGRDVQKVGISDGQIGEMGLRKWRDKSGMTYSVWGEGQLGVWKRWAKEGFKTASSSSRL